MENSRNYSMDEVLRILSSYDNLGSRVSALLKRYERLGIPPGRNPLEAMKARLDSVDETQLSCLADVVKLETREFIEAVPAELIREYPPLKRLLEEAERLT